jgi:hypothetical protein
LPLEDEISKAVIKCFPQLQRDYAALAMQLKTLGPPAVERAENTQDSITEILRGYASDATSWLGGETCPLADDLEWARKVKKSLDNGIDTLIEQLRTCSTEIRLQDSAMLGADGCKSCLPVMMHQRFDLAVVKLANPFQ